MTIEQNVPLAPFTTLRVGGKAAFFCRLRYPGDLPEIAAFVKQKGRQFFVLGEGSNTLISDSGFNGLVVKNELRGIKESLTALHDDKHVEIQVASGENWDQFVAYAVSKKLYGIEALSFIPGSVGAAAVGNIGAYGTEVKETISEVEFFDCKTGKTQTFTNAQCAFTYRNSIFKTPKARSWIITKVTFRLERNGRVNIGYKDVKEYFSGRYSSDVTLEELRNAVIEIRQRKLPDPAQVGTAGSFFKNPIITMRLYEKLRTLYHDMPGFSEVVGADGLPKKVKVPAAWLIDKVCGLRGWREGSVGTHEKQALALVNYGGATADDIERAAHFISQSVREKTAIVLQWEVQKI